MTNVAFKQTNIQEENYNKIKKGSNSIFDGYHPDVVLEAFNSVKNGGGDSLPPELFTQMHLAFCESLTSRENNHALNKQTGLIDRDTLSKVVNQKEFNFKGRFNKRFLYFIDFNFFKFVNDVCGHGAGDICLSVVAKRLIEFAAKLNIDQGISKKKSLQLGMAESNFAVRRGGDEFLLVTTKKVSKEELREAITGDSFEIETMDFGTRTIVQSVSIGESVLTENIDFETAIKTADCDMYLDKKEIKGGFGEEARGTEELELYLFKNLLNLSLKEYVAFKSKKNKNLKETEKKKKMNNASMRIKELYKLGFQKRYAKTSLSI